MDKLHKVIDHKVLVCHCLVNYFEDARHIEAWYLPDMVVTRNPPILLPFLSFSNSDLVLRNRLIESIQRPGCIYQRNVRSKSVRRCTGVHLAIEGDHLDAGQRI